jgi:hypothetical protein
MYRQNVHNEAELHKAVMKVLHFWVNTSFPGISSKMFVITVNSTNNELGNIHSITVPECLEQFDHGMVLLTSHLTGRITIPDVTMVIKVAWVSSVHRNICKASYKAPTTLHFNQNCQVSTKFRNTSQYQILWKSVHLFSGCYMWIDRQAKANRHIFVPYNLLMCQFKPHIHLGAAMLVFSDPSCIAL